jgi:hypothetical protein
VPDSAPPTRSIWRFRIGDVLPSSDPEARFVTVVSAALNDLLFINGLLDRNDGGPEERQYLWRTAISHLWEFSKMLREWQGQQPALALFAKLDVTCAADLTTVVGVASTSDPVSKTIACLRDTTAWHYAKPGKDKVIGKALDEARDLEGTLEFGATTGTIRASFADLIILQVSTQQFPGVPEAEAIHALYSRSSELMTAAIRVAEKVLVAFFEGLPAGVVTFE